MRVVGHETRRRWAVVLAAVAVLCATPAAVAAWPVHTPRISTGTLRERIRLSAGQPYQGYAVSTGTMGLPALPRLQTVTALFSGTTRMRAWYAGPDRWRVDVLDTGTERDLYQAPDGQYVWDYDDNRLTLVTGDQSFRLPRAADLMPPDLARRLLGAAAGDRVTRLDGQRVAGIDAAGLRIRPTDPHTSVGHVDIWADPASGLPLRVEVTGRGAAHPVLASRFLDVGVTAPAAPVLAPPAPRPGLGLTVTSTPDVLGALRRFDLAALPDRLAGQARRDTASPVSAIGLYGDGLARFVVVRLPGRLGDQAYDSAGAWGQAVRFAGGEAALISTSLLSVMIMHSTADGRYYLLAGLVDGQWLRQVGAELAGFRS